MEDQDAVETLDSIHKGTFKIEDSKVGVMYALADLAGVIKLLDNRLKNLQAYVENRVPHL